MVLDQQMAETCVEAALDLAELLPSSDPQSLYENGPWCSIVHLSEYYPVCVLFSATNSMSSYAGDGSPALRISLPVGSSARRSSRCQEEREEDASLAKCGASY